MSGAVQVKIIETVKIRPKAALLHLAGLGYQWVPLSVITGRRGNEVWIAEWWYTQKVDDLADKLARAPARPEQLQKLKGRFEQAKA